MSERERPRSPEELPVPEGLGHRFGGGGDAGGSVTVDYGVYREELPLGGRTVAEIRRIVGPRYDIDPRAAATVDGLAADNQTVLRAGQELRFMHIAGEKGQQGELPIGELLGGEAPDSLLGQMLGLRSRAPRRRAPPKVTIEGPVVTVKSPEGRTAAMRLETLLSRLVRGGPSGRDTRDLVMPDGVKWVMSRREHTIIVHQTPPAVHSFKWIASGSPAKYGPGTAYRQVSIALPYVIVFAIFLPRRDGRLRLGDANECFFRTEPLRSPDDKLCYPALLNCSRFDSSERPLSWICTQNLVHSRLPLAAGVNERVRQGLADLMRCLFETGFNYSSDEHELSSWFTETTRVDPRVSSVERWEQATRKDPMFVAEIPWLPVGKSVRQVAERAMDFQTGRTDRPRTSYDVARVLYNHGKVRKSAAGESEA
jgi:hypothetical protein